MTQTQKHPTSKTRRYIHLGLIVGLLGFLGVPTWAQTQPTPTPPPLATVPFIDVERYQGVWYQVALIPNRFQKQCVSHTQATYKLLSNGHIEVTNACRNASGAMEQVVGEARRAQKYGAKLANGQLTPPMLQVRFAPSWVAALPFMGERVWGDYWVIQLANDYRYAVVGDPTRAFLWLLGRSPQLAAADRATINSRLVEQGYNPALLRDEVH